MREEGVSQEVFAAVSFGRTQGLLSDMLKKGDLGVQESTTTRHNLAAIGRFLGRSRQVRLRMYEEYRQGGRHHRWLHQQQVRGASCCFITSHYQYFLAANAFSKIYNLEFWPIKENKGVCDKSMSGKSCLDQQLIL